MSRALDSRSGADGSTEVVTTDLCCCFPLLQQLCECQDHQASQQQFG